MKFEGSSEFRRIKRDDLRSCAELFVAVFNDEPWNENWRIEGVVARLEECYATPGFVGVMAGDGDALAFALGQVESWDRSKHFFLKEMCVRQDRQRSGLGTRLLERLEEEVRGAGAGKIYLLTARGSAAESFYRKNGFYVSPKMVMMGKYLEAERSNHPLR